MSVERPKHCTDRMLLFLDRLRESGVTNMFGAAPYLQQAFPRLNRQKACSVVGYWMKTFSERHPR